MTEEQYERWKDFARRMVNVAVGPRKRSPSRKTVRENIDFFFLCRMEPCDEWKRVRDWDYTDDEDRYATMCVSSHISDLGENFIPNYWSLGHEEYERAVEQWIGPVSCCLRAGLDVAVSPSAGVAGFTAGDLRAMYSEGVPDWIKQFFSPPRELTELIPSNIDGIYLPGESRTEARTFDQLPDTEPVWL